MKVSEYLNILQSGKELGGMFDVSLKVFLESQIGSYLFIKIEQSFEHLYHFHFT